MLNVSVIIPTYNRKDLIQQTLNSIKPQRHPKINIEAIVIDDHSTDGTFDFLLKEYPDIKVINNPGKGAQAARNAGLAMALHPYIMYLDSDDLVGENFFLEKLELLEREVQLNACYGYYRYFESDADLNKQKYQYKISYPIYNCSDNQLFHLRSYLGGQYIPQNAIIWRSAFLTSIGGHDERLSINQDVELVIRALLHHLTIAPVIDDTYVYIRSHEHDTRVGSAIGSEKKLREILELRKDIFERLKKQNISNKFCLHDLSLYLFNKWREIRHLYPQLADDYLNFAKTVYWPVRLRGGILLKVLTILSGPVNAIKIKEMRKK